ncbi:hypothetical protein QAD02_021817 [Eretmocerus hayati]|uniref:Uncharacterized protein n=1 Tax=Eretmocerus hayati TaxID=131215 RepID=A0ACC2PRS6_9HYME|nr:hypothetical protein QAD02_021817 [Eretmocerus hayati]
MVTVEVVNGTKTQSSKGVVCFEFKSRVNDTASYKASAFIVTSVSQYKSKLKVGEVSWQHLTGLELADPDYLSDKPIVLLLGVVVGRVVLGEVVKAYHVVTDERLDDQLQTFWRQRRVITQKK